MFFFGHIAFANDQGVHDQLRAICSSETFLVVDRDCWARAAYS